MQERQGIVSQKGNISVVDQGGEIKRVAKKSGQEVARAACKDWEKQKLYHVKVKV